MRDPMAGYSGTPLARKLGIAPGHRVALVDAPGELVGMLAGEVPEAEFRPGFGGDDPFDVALLFVRSRAELEAGFGPATRRMTQAGGLWVAWPKRASGVATDMTEDVARQVGLPTGFVDNKVCAIDETWSGLRFVLRRELRDLPVKGRPSVRAR